MAHLAWVSAKANSSTLMNNATAIRQAGFQYYNINSGQLKNIDQEESLAESVISIMKKKQKSFVCVRFSAQSLKTKADYVTHVAKLDKFVGDIELLTKKSTAVTIILT